MPRSLTCVQLEHRLDAALERAELWPVPEQQVVVLLQPVRKLLEVSHVPANVAHRLQHDLLGVLLLRVGAVHQLIDLLLGVLRQVLPFLVQLLELLADQVSEALTQLWKIVQVASDRIRAGLLGRLTGWIREKLRVHVQVVRWIHLDGLITVN